MSCLNMLFVFTFVFYIGPGAFTLIYVFIHYFTDVIMRYKVWHLDVEGTLTTLVRSCSLLDGSLSPIWCAVL